MIPQITYGLNNNNKKKKLLRRNKIYSNKQVKNDKINVLKLLFGSYLILTNLRLTNLDWIR